MHLAHCSILESAHMCDLRCCNLSLFNAENFEMTEDEEITLQGFYTLHQMTANDSEGGVEELCDILTAMGYDASLKLRYVSLRA